MIVNSKTLVQCTSCSMYRAIDESESTCQDAVKDSMNELQQHVLLAWRKHLCWYR